MTINKKEFIRIIDIILGDNQYFSSEQRRVTGISITASIAAFICSLLNYMLSLANIMVFAAFCFGILYLTYYYYNRFKGIYKNFFWLLLLPCYIFIIITWFYNVGISGPTIIISFIIVVFTNLIATRRQLYLSITFILIIIGILFLIEYFYGDLITPYQIREEKFIDNYFSFFVAVLLTSFIVSFILEQFKAEKEKNRRTEKKLKESEYLFRVLAETTSTAIILYRGDAFIYTNPAVQKICGYSPLELKSMKFWDLVVPEHEELIKKFERLIQKRKKQISGIEIKISTKTSEEKSVYVEGSSIDYYGKQAGLVSVIDITKLKRTEEELGLIRSYLANIINSMPSILVGIDSDINITQWNCEAEKQIGIKAEKAVGKSLIHELPRLEPIVMKIRATINEHKIHENIRLVHQSNGQAHHESVTIYPLMAKGFKGAVIRLDDVTEKVRLEEIIIQSEKMLSIGGLAAGMAHEINNPLGGIMQNVQLISSRFRYDLQSNEKIAVEAGTTMEVINDVLEKMKFFKYLTNIRKSGIYVAKIVENMLSFAKKDHSERSPHDLAELLKRTIELAYSDYDPQKKYDFKQIEIVNEFELGLPYVVCEENKIIQVFFNIIKNAAEAMYEVGERKDKLKFIFRLAKEDSMVRIEIEDNGPGMEESTKKRIFEPFYTTKKVGEGTGLGLSLCYFIIVDDHCGKMEVESNPGKGTKFIIRLPF